MFEFINDWLDGLAQLDEKLHKLEVQRDMREIERERVNSVRTRKTMNDRKRVNKDN